MKRRGVILVALAALLVGSCGRDHRTVAEKYPGEWSTAFNIDIGRTFTKSKFDCRHWMWRRSADDSTILIAYTHDGHRWFQRIAYPSIGELSGAQELDASIEQSVLDIAARTWPRAQ